MTTATVSSKGQITLPAEVRQALRVEAGDRVEFVRVALGRFELIAATQSIRSLKGMFGRPTNTVPIEDMNRAIEARGSTAR
ncbi:MAG: AbrB/MazE/SpoVT family DNA-binding domain-containing protein [Proteobacteria bacterium]|nr:AbrB/MazE/SpoVT family DNA-binding domain-containing protein [Pseudomonadota bacterium]